jgi:ubiquinone/menaquinone biosynthesis C-methylase UbiE
MAYAEKVAEELNQFHNQPKWHELPAMASYCAQKFWQPKIQAVGFADINEFYIAYIVRLYAARQGTLQLISIGAGRCALELTMAQALLARGITDWEFHCLDLNQEMLAAGERQVSAAGLGAHFKFLQTDITQWQVKPDYYDFIFACHSLHHFTELEILFEKIHASLKPSGYFVVNDMIGRNGHRRWPEALAILEVFWRTLEPRHKYNHSTRQTDEAYVDLDCSQYGFEGIRAQDILPLLVRTFSFEMFLGFGNVSDIFIDRVYGHNYDPESEKDRYIIDAVATFDDFFIEQGFYKPTHILAAMMKQGLAPQTRCYKHLTPEFCVYKV